MGYQNNIERDRPIVFKTFDDATNKTHPLVAGLGSAALVTTSAFTHTFDQWTQGPFTLEVWFKPLTTNTVTVLGHDDDGITYNGVDKTITFTVKQINGTMISTTQSAPAKVMHVVAQYSGRSITLIVNGNSTSADSLLPLTTTGSLRTGAGKMSVDALAMYNYLLSDFQVQVHYYEGTNFPPLDSVYSIAENFFELTDDREEVYVDLTYPSWNGYFDGAIIDSNNILVNDIGVNDGKWYTSIMLPDDLVLGGGKLFFDYDGASPVAEVSLDGNTWTSVTNGGSLSVIPNGSTLVDVDPIVRLTLGSDTVVSFVRVLIYSSSVSVGTKDTRQINLTRPATSALEQMYPYEQDDNGGANIAGGSLTINDLTDDVVAGLSFWYKGDEPTAGDKNGGIGHIDGQWNFYYGLVTGLPNTYNGRIANVATWSTSQDSAKLYGRHFSKPTLIVQDSNQISFYEPENGLLVYQNNWAVL